jgi:hypothetical protein
MIYKHGRMGTMSITKIYYLDLYNIYYFYTIYIILMYGCRDRVTSEQLARFQ